jgi:hypothetical protein
MKPIVTGDENHIMRSCIIWSLHQILLKRLNKQDQIVGSCSTHDRKSQKISVGETVGLIRGHSGDLVLYERTILKQILQKQE